MLRSYRSKLQFAFVLLGSVAIAFTGWQSWAGATAALERATSDRLSAIRQTRSRQIERYFEDLHSHVLALSSDESTIVALEEFEQAWGELPPLPPSSEEVLLRHYQEFFRSVPGGQQAGDWMPQDVRARTLQHHFIAANPHPIGYKDRLLDVPAAGRYGRAHARFHPTLHRYQTAFGFYDIFLLDPEGRVLYSVFKEIDLGVQITRDPYRNTALSRVFQKAIAVTELEHAVVEDYARYLPSHDAPAAFVAAPVWRRGEKIGVLAIQISIAEVNRVMTANRNWREEGLGETGQAYIVGADGALRSDLRQEIEKPANFLSQLRQANLDSSLIERIKANHTAVLNLKVPGFPKSTAEPSTEQTTNLLHIQILRSSVPLAVPGLAWTLVAEIDTSEAFAPVTQLRSRIIGYGILIAAIFFLAATALARSVTEPVLQLTRSAHRMAERDFSVRTTVHSSDELGELAATFNRMAEDLERTTVSKQEVDRILSSLINAVFVIEVEVGATADDLLSSPIREANPAAAKLLGYSAEELRGLALGQLLPGPEWKALLARLYRERHLSTVEAELLRADRSTVPVFFNAAYLSAQPHRPGGVVCAAQDITEYRKATLALKQKQQELERLAGRLIEAQEEERTRVARELHDDLTQRLAAVAIEAGRLQNLTSADAQQWREGLDNIKQKMASLSTDVHGLSRRLHPSSLDDLGLVAALQSECRSFFERGGPPVELEVSGIPDDLDKDIVLALYRIAQESLRNIGKHAQASQVWLTLAGSPDSIRLTIHDDGSGFDPSKGRRSPGLGLASMEERARLLGGGFSVVSTPGEGTTIQVTMPTTMPRAETA